MNCGYTSGISVRNFLKEFLTFFLYGVFAFLDLKCELQRGLKELKSTVKFLNDVRVQNNCIINGVKIENETIGPMQAVLDLAKKTGADICENEIDDAYYLNANNNKAAKKSLVVKFVNKKSKNLFMSGKAKLKQIDKLKRFSQQRISGSFQLCKNLENCWG